MSISSDSRRCPTCGGPIPAEAPQGLCPKCLLLQASVPTEAGRETSPRPVPPTLEELAAAFPQLEVLELIGQGGMGFVFKARQPKIERLVALKILPQSLAADPAFAERFAREGRVLARLNHPNIVTLYDFGQAGGFFYLLMEFVDGVNLRQAMKVGRFTPAQALAVVPKICDALQFAHNEGVLHRDIKPENILLDAKGRVKIADFGIAKLGGTGTGEAGAAGATGPAAAGLTETGKVLGTPNYMAPEQLEHPQEVDERADIYSLGVVFYEMLTGGLPVGSFAPPSEKSAVDPRIDEVVLRTLAKERERRTQTAGEVKTQVETIAATAQSSGSEPAAANFRSSGRKSAVVVGALVILVFAIVLTTQLMSRFSHEKAAPGCATAQELKDRFEQALKSRDTNAIISLFNWRGVSASMRSFQLGWRQDNLMKPPANDSHVSVRLLPLPDDYETESVRDGIRYTPNVSLVGEISGGLGWLDHGTNSGWAVVLPYGTNAHGYFLAGTEETRIYTSKTKDKALRISVTSSNDHSSVTFTCSLVYVQNGREIQKDFTNGFMSKAYFGDHIKSCVVRKISNDQGSVQLALYQAGKKIFESPYVQTKEPIVYERTATGLQPSAQSAKEPQRDQPANMTGIPSPAAGLEGNISQNAGANVNAGKTVALTGATNELLNATNNLRVVRVRTDSTLLPGEKITAMTRGIDGQMVAAQSSFFIMRHHGSVGTSTLFAWMLGDSFGPEDYEFAASQIHQNWAERPVTLTPGKLLELYSVTNRYGGVLTGYLQFERALPPAPEASGTSGSPAQAIVHFRPYAYSLLVFYSATMPPGYFLEATDKLKDLGEVDAYTEVDSGGAGWNSSWSPPQSFTYEQRLAAARRLTQLEEKGPLTVVYGQPALLFAMTNNAGETYKGFFELIGPSAPAKP